MGRGHQNWVWSVVPLALCVAGCTGPAPTAKPNDTTRREFETRFLKFCDLATAELNKELTPFLNRTNADPPPITCRFSRMRTPHARWP